MAQSHTYEPYWGNDIEYDCDTGELGPPTSHRVDQQFTKAYADANEVLLSDALLCLCEGDFDQWLVPNPKIFGLPGNAAVGSEEVIRSVDDLDDYHAQRVQKVLDVAEKHEWHVFFARLRSTWDGPRELTPNRSCAVSSSASASTGGRPPSLPRGFKKIDALVDDDDPESGVRVEHRLIELHDMHGNAIIPESVVPGEPTSMPIVTNERFIQDDFFSFKPDKEYIKKASENGGVVGAKQTWYKNVSQFLSSSLGFIFTGSC